MNPEASVTIPSLRWEDNPKTRMFLNLGWSSTLFGSGGTLMLLLISPFCFPELLSNDKNWWILPAICFMLAMIHLFGGAFLPESPKHLFIGQSQESEARTSARFYHGSEVNMSKRLVFRYSLFIKQQLDKLKKKSWSNTKTNARSCIRRT
jgi:hypothetical protein